MSKEKKPAWYVTNILVPVAVELAKDILARFVEWVWEKLVPKKAENESD